jgi:hypothetical protein
MMALTFDSGFIVYGFMVDRGKGNVNTLVVRRHWKWRLSAEGRDLEEEGVGIDSSGY